MRTNFTKQRMIITFFIIFSLATTKMFAQLPADFTPLYGQTAEWFTDANNELKFDGTLPMGSPAIIATTFGGLTNPGGNTNDFTDLKLTFDAFVASGGASTTIVLSSNGTWGGKGILIEINEFQIRGVRNFDYNTNSATPPIMLSSDVTTYQGNPQTQTPGKVKPGVYNNFIIDVDASSKITVTINGYVCPTTYSADATILKAALPNPRFAFFATGFSPFQLKNLTATKVGITPKTYFTSTLPVTLIKYEATKKANGSQLNWETASESNNSHYLVYRSTDGANFKQIAKIAGNNKASKYQYLDQNPASGDNYYKLVQFDFDGKFEELGIRAVNFELQADNTVSIYPKPADDKINLSFNRTFDSDISVKIFDLSGREVQKTTITAQKEAVNYVLDLDEKINSGIYIINISSGQYKHSERIIVK